LPFGLGVKARLRAEGSGRTAGERPHVEEGAEVESAGGEGRALLGIVAEDAEPGGGDRVAVSVPGSM
jgi:hypothetical protein